MTAETIITRCRERLRAQGQNMDNFRKGWNDGPADGHISMLTELSHLIETLLSRAGGISKNFSVPLVADQQSYDIDLTVNEMIGEVWWDDGDGRVRTLRRITYADYLERRWTTSAFINEIFPNPDNNYGTPYAYCLGDDRDDTDTTSAILVLPAPNESTGTVKFTATYTPAALTYLTNLDALMQRSVQSALVDLLNAHLLGLVNADISQSLSDAAAGAVSMSADDKGGPDSNKLSVRVYSYYER